MSATYDRLIDQAVDAVEELCAPGMMSKAEAVDFLEEVIARLQTSIAALHDEIENASDEGEE